MLVCVLVADFATQVERLISSTRAPLLLTTGIRPIVAALDAQSRAQGVRRGMPSKRARALCPDAEVRPLVESRLRPRFEALLEVVGQFASRFEVQPPLKGTDPIVWLDLSTAADAPAAAYQLQAAIRDRAGLVSGVGNGQGKFPVLVGATLRKVIVIPAGREAAFLAPHPVDLLPLLSDERRRLGLFGLHTLGQLAALPRGAVLAQFGLRGRLLHQLACGEDPRPLIPYQPPRVERLRRRFSEPLADESQFDRCLMELATEAASVLHKQATASSAITLCLTFETGQAREALRAPREPLSAERPLLRLLQGLSASLPRAGVVAIEVELSALSAEQPQQLRLFDAPAKKSRTARDVARTLMLRHASSAFVTPVMTDEAELIPETISFLPLEEGL